MVLCLFKWIYDIQLKIYKAFVQLKLLNNFTIDNSNNYFSTEDMMQIVQYITVTKV